MEAAKLKEQILNSVDLVTEQVEVPEWKATVNVRTLTGTERDDFEASIIKDRKTDLRNIRAKLCVKCIVDDKGKPVFTGADVVELGKKSALALDRVFTVASRLNGLSPKDIEELAKNSGTGQSDNSTSD